MYKSNSGAASLSTDVGKQAQHSKTLTVTQLCEADQEQHGLLLTTVLLGDICFNSNAANAFAAQLLSHNLGLLEVDVHYGH